MKKDRVNVTKEVDKNGKESLSYRKSWEKNGINHSIEVKKVEGGYIIVEEKYGTPKDKIDAEYISERSERVSTTNPFNEEKEDKLTDEKMFGFVDNPNF